MEVVETIIPKNEMDWLALRSQDLTSTEIPALFGCSPYVTEFELYHRHAGGFQVERGNEWTSWGKRLQYAIARGVAKDNGWKIRAMKEYMRIPELRLGSSFDYEITPDGILEVKNVFGMKFKDEWIVQDGQVEAPPHVELQVQHQLLVSGKAYSQIVAFVGGNQVITARREPNEKIFEAIKNKAAQFWAAVDSKQPPEPNFQADADFICKLYANSKAGSVIQATEELTGLARAYSQYGSEKKAAEDAQKAVKAQILMLSGEAEKVLGDGFSISTATVAGGIVEAFERKPFRGCRVNWKKRPAGSELNA